MAVYVVTGKLGAGKSLVVVDRIRQALNEGRRIATNLDLNLESLINQYAKQSSVTRLSDVPTRDQLDLIGLGYEGDKIDEAKNGILALDECAKFLNSRSWNDKGRKAMIDWLIHARKKRWDVYFIIQDIDAMDKQIKDLFGEHLVTCSRSDRMTVPLIGPFLKLIFGLSLPVPKVHNATVRYGITQNAPIVDRWITTGTSIYKGYDTEQSFNELDSCGINSLLPPFLTYGRYKTRYEHFKEKFKNFGFLTARFFFILGFLISLAYSSYTAPNPQELEKGVFTCSDTWKDLFGSCSTTLADARLMLTSKSASAPSPSGGGADVLAAGSTDSTIFISGSVKSTKAGYSYTLIQDDNTFHYDGLYSVIPIDACSAVLSSLTSTEKTKIFCQP